jgi:hypothetical protein
MMPKICISCLRCWQFCAVFGLHGFTLEFPSHYHGFQENIKDRRVIGQDSPTFSRALLNLIRQVSPRKTIRRRSVNIKGFQIESQTHRKQQRHHRMYVGFSQHTLLDYPEQCRKNKGLCKYKAHGNPIKARLALRPKFSNYFNRSNLTIISIAHFLAGLANPPGYRRLL